MAPRPRTGGELVARLPWLDKVATPLQQAAGKFFGASAATTRLKDWLNGTPLGHRTHPAMVVAPLGAWTMATLFDLLDSMGGDERWGPAADLAVAVGAIGALPSMLAGLADWVDTYDHPRRLGVAHALVNSVALTTFAISSGLRAAGHRPTARAFSRAGFGLVVVGGALGGELVYNLGVNVSYLLYPKAPNRFTDVLASNELVGGEPVVVEVDRVPVLLLRRRGAILAVQAWCPHAGGPLVKGTCDGDTIECPWHGSRFELASGRALRGPATAPLRTFVARERSGRIGVRPADLDRGWPPHPAPPGRPLEVFA